MEIKTTTLTTSQSQLSKVFEAWLKTKSTTFTISGHAGTGKTFMINYLVNKYLSDKRVIVSAPTHKAVKVVSDKCGIKGKTIHSLHGLRPNFNIDSFNIDKVKFDTIAANKFDQYEYIIMDEASMIGSELKELNDIRAKEYGSRIIYVGDELQLNPIKSVGISDVFKISDTFHLTDVVRQEEGHPLLQLFPMLRHDVVNGDSTFISFIRRNRKDIDNGVGYIVNNSYDFQIDILKSFVSDDYKNNIDFVRYTAYTNDSIKEWNTYIRSKLFNSPKELIVKNDLLLGYNTVVDENMAQIIINSEDYRVVDVQTRLSYDDFKIYVVTIKQIGSTKERIINVVDHTDKSFINFYNKLYMLHQNALFAKGSRDRPQLWRKYFDYKNEYLVMRDFQLINHTGQVRATVKKDLDYSYGVTVHKLQGSTVDNIFINMLDICYFKGNPRTPRRNSKYDPNAIDTRNRLLYTGLSRASKMAHLLI